MNDKRYSDIANRIWDKKSFTDAVLRDINFNQDKRKIFEAFESNLSKELVFYDKGLTFADNKFSARRTIKSLEDNLLSTSNRETKKKITHNMYEFLKLKQGVYVFDFESILEKTYNADIYTIINEISDTIYLESVIYVVNEINKINKLKSIFYSTNIENIKSFLNNNIAKFIKDYLFYICVVSIVLASCVLYYFGIFRLIVSTTTEQTVSLALLGTVTALSGFAVVFFQLSFDNFNKYYGFYAKTILFRVIGKGLIVLLFFNILTATFCAIIANEHSATTYNSRIILIQNLKDVFKM